ncbi:hypothetical protein PIB30_085939, partial [Stylosanthes scabra]|nr:hypothetical protein [Stylosanthes scabra]
MSRFRNVARQSDLLQFLGNPLQEQGFRKRCASAGRQHSFFPAAGGFSCDEEHMFSLTVRKCQVQCSETFAPLPPQVLANPRRCISSAHNSSPRCRSFYHQA